MSRRSSDAPPPPELPRQLTLPLWSEPEARPSTESKPPDPPGTRAEPTIGTLTDAGPGIGDRAGPAGSDPPGNRLSTLVPRFLEFAIAIDRSPHTIHTVGVDL
ncbi:MAG: hypothetical protein ACRDIY_10165, partial [Chloroflexota bacterium]